MNTLVFSNNFTEFDEFELSLIDGGGIAGAFEAMGGCMVGAGIACASVGAVGPGCVIAGVGGVMLGVDAGIDICSQ